MGLFDETYRVVAVERERLTIQGLVSGEVLTIVNAQPNVYRVQDYPPGKLITLSDPCAGRLPN